MVDGDHRNVVVEFGAQGGVAVDIHFLVIERRPAAGRLDHRLSLVAEAAAGARVEGDQGRHHQERSRRRQNACFGRIRWISRMPATNPPTCANQAVPPWEMCEYPMV